MTQLSPTLRQSQQIAAILTRYFQILYENSDDLIPTIQASRINETSRSTKHDGQSVLSILFVNWMDERSDRAIDVAWEEIQQDPLYEKEVDILYRRYVLYETINDIAAQYGVATRTIARWHRKAAIAFLGRVAYHRSERATPYQCEMADIKFDEIFLWLR